MFRIARLFVTLGASRLATLRDRAGHRVGFVALIAVLCLLFAIFGLAAIAAALAEWLGVVAAFSFMAASAFLGLIVALLVMRAIDRRDRERLAEKAALQRRLSQVAMLAAFGDRGGRGLRLGRIAGLGLLAGALVVLLSGGRDDEDPDD